MVRVQEISKYYGTQLAVDHVSFEIHRGEIVGFIGPNGAGKSTTMKIITGTLSPEEGEVVINGIPVREHRIKTRKILGYLPEHNPLYPEMYIREYLLYVAGLYGIHGRKASDRTGEVMEMTGLFPEADKKIGNLSKGYRQRVGLAQALVHDPEILILDEPTSGLDPNQLTGIRGLISSIGKEKTVLLSTHILQEVEAICDRVLIINRGRIVKDSRAGLLQGGENENTQTILVELESGVDPRIWKTLPFIRNVRALAGFQYLLETDEMRDIRGEVFKFAVEQHLTILSLTFYKKSLEEVFREMTEE